MNRRKPAETDVDATMLEQIADAGPDALPLELKLGLMRALHEKSTEASEACDRHMLADVARLHGALADARKSLDRVREMMERLTAPPWHPAVYLGPCARNGGPTAVVAQGASRRIVHVGTEVDPSDLSAGDEVLLSHEMNCIVGRSPHPVFLAGELASFDRCTADGRLVLSAHDEEIVVDAAQALRDAAPKRGDLVRWDRATGLAYERIDRAEGQQFFLEEMPQDSFDDIGGLDAQIEELKRAVLVRFDPVLADLASRYGLKAKKAALLWGPPGTGKTMIVRGLANHLGRLSPTGKARFINVKPGALNSMWFGQSEQQYREVFRVARAASEDARIPTVLYFDEVDAIGSARGHSASHLDDRVLRAFMAELDGLEARGNVMVIASTNRLDALDPALVRPGRLGDCVIYVGPPDRQAARAILSKHLRVAIPFYCNGHGSDVAAARNEILDAVVARLYAANAGSEIASVTLRDSKRVAVKARDLLNGAVLAKIAQIAIEGAYMRESAGGAAGVTLADALCAADAEVSSLARVLTPANCRLFLSSLPQDVDVVSVQPTTRNATDASGLMSLT